jgi:uncharacterized protein (DUF2384 family)
VKRKNVKSENDTLAVLSAKLVADFVCVTERALQVLHPDEVAAFFTFPQPFLNGARPIDVMVTRGAEPVIRALNQIDSGAFI